MFYLPDTRSVSARENDQFLASCLCSASQDFCGETGGKTESQDARFSPFSRFGLCSSSLLSLLCVHTAGDGRARSLSSPTNRETPADTDLVFCSTRSHGEQQIKKPSSIRSSPVGLSDDLASLTKMQYGQSCSHPVFYSFCLRDDESK